MQPAIVTSLRPVSEFVMSCLSFDWAYLFKCPIAILGGDFTVFSFFRIAEMKFLVLIYQKALGP